MTATQSRSTERTEPARARPAHLESAEKRRQRRSTGILIVVVGALLLILLVSTTGSARFALSDAFDPVQLPTVAMPGLPTVAICAVLCLVCGAAFLSGRMRRFWPVIAAVVAGLAVVVGFLTWAAAGRDLPFPVANQFAGTLSLATPLVLGALCGVLCERSGVVNVAIEGQFLTAAFAAAVVGSITQSVLAALIAAVVAGVAMAALLALFAITYLVNQVVLGVVLNLLAVGVTGFLFDQLVQPAADKYNSAPVLQTIAIPGLVQHPVLRPGAVRADHPGLSGGDLGGSRLVDLVQDHLGAADPLGRRAPGGRRHRGHRRPRDPLVGGAHRGSVRRAGRGVLHPRPRPARSPRSSRWATASSRWRR